MFNFKNIEIVLMKKTQILSAMIALFLSAQTVAAEKKEFGRTNILIGADPATIKLMSAVAAKADNKIVKVAPEIELRYPRQSLKLFCRGSSARYPDMVVTTREMNVEEYERCQNNNIGSIIKLKIGYEALVVAGAKGSFDLNLDQRKLFLALASDVPKNDKDGMLQENPNIKWKDIDAELPDKTIKILGPADETRDARTVRVLGMEVGCRTWEWVAELKHIQKSHRLYRAICHEPREDGAYVKAESAQTDLVKTLQKNKDSVVLLSFNEWLKSKDKVKTYAIDDLPPTIGTISKGLYHLSRSYYVYIKAANLSKVKSLAHFMKELVNEKTLAKDGYLADLGMVAMPEKEIKREVQQAAEFAEMPRPEED